jgi:glycosyltransferase involved in cell wall biosynthesis
VPFPIRDGQARRTYHILRGLADRHDVHLLSLAETADERAPETIAHLERFCAAVEVVPGPDKTPTVSMVARLLRSLVSLEPYTVWRHYSRAYAERVRAAVRTGGYDVIHCDILPLAYVTSSPGGGLWALTDHDVSYLKAARLARQHRNPLARLFIGLEAVKLKRLERRMCRAMDLVVTVSELDRALLQRLVPDARFAVVDNGVDVEAFVPDPGACEPDSLLWLGGFRQHGNFEAMRFFLEEVYPAVKQARPGVRLYVVGADAPSSLVRMAAGDSSVIFTGFVDDPVPYIQRAAVFVAPILSGSGTKLKVLEAMAAGKAIVSTSVGVEGIKGHNGEHYVVADKADEFAARTIDLLNDGPRRARLSANARRLAEEMYDWKSIGQQMSAVYETAVANRA